MRNWLVNVGSVEIFECEWCEYYSGDRAKMRKHELDNHINIGYYQPSKQHHVEVRAHIQDLTLDLGFLRNGDVVKIEKWRGSP